MTIDGKHFINGNWAAGTEQSITEVEPWAGKPIVEYQLPSDQQISSAVDSASRAQVEWYAIGTEKRIQHLQNFISVLEAKKDELSTIVAQEAGKPYWEAEQEVGILPGKLDASISAYKNRAQDILAPSQDPSIIVKTSFRPHGTCLVLGPYNFPLHMMNGQVIPALLSGNSVIIKPSELGCASAIQYVEAADEAGLPRGVIQLLLGSADLGKQLVCSEGVGAVFFTGSASAGQSIRQKCAERNVPCAIEAGGNSVLVVGDFDNVEKTSDIIVNSAFWSAGQRCNSARHLLITQAAYERGIIDALVSKVSNLRSANDITDSTAFYGVMRREDDISRLADYTAKLTESADDVIFGTQISPMESIVPFIVRMPTQLPLEQEEQMGPVLQVRIVADLQQAIEVANSVELRLTAGLLSRSRDEYNEFSRMAEFGNIVWNCPTANASGYASFGGRGDSGNSRPAGYLAIDFCVTPVSEFMVPDGTA
ncbi:aldehyde dehydrogenase family protein [Roseovarius ramblicola]|uniref:Aldehyde dehydrogenase family protein n=1 Tax=Roseovarius ramblicola TaxID=2022336 RepID=A0ABV5HYK6_9RHOB